MPKGINEGPFREAPWSTIFPGNSEADRRAKNADGEISCPRDQPELNALFQGEFPPRLISSGRSRRCSDAHAIILSGADDLVIGPSETPYANLSGRV